MSSPATGADSGDLAARLSHYAELIRAELDGALSAPPGLEPYYGMMSYHIGWLDQDFRPRPARPGKSLRPSLCLLLAEALGAAAEDGAALAAGIELLHNFSLVHDDIEDRSATRRGRPTVWSIWGEPQAINTGDGLFALAHRVWLQSPLAHGEPATWVAILGSLEATIVALCEGQFLDMYGERNLDLSSAAYLAMIERKTAALIGAAAWVGATVAGADRATAEAARAFGRELGLAFQIRDDLLGIWGDERTTGKSASSDIASRKMTLPIILALESSPPEGRAALRSRYGAPPVAADDEAHIRALLEAAGADRQAEAQERAHWQAALDALDALPLSPAWSAHLRAFAGAFVARST